MNMRGFLSVLAAVALAAAPAGGEEGLGLPAVVEAALARSPLVGGMKAAVREAESALTETRARRLPNLTARTGFTRGNEPVYAFGSLLDQRSFTERDFAVSALNHPAPRNNFRSTLELGMPLFTGFDLRHAQQAGSLGVDAARLSREQAVEKVLQQAVESFLAVLLGRELIRAVEERIRSAEAEVESARQLRDKGLVLGSDYQAALAVLGGLKARLAGLNGGLRAAQARLGVLMGRPDGAASLKGGLTAVGYAGASGAELEAAALRERRELRQAGVEQALAEVGRDRAGSSILPKVEAFASVSDDTEDFGSHAADAMMGVRLDFRFGDPSYLPRRDRAAARLEAARAARSGAEDAVRADALSAFEDYEAARTTLPIMKETMERADAALRLFKPLYRQGRQSIIEVLRAEEGLCKAQAGYVETAHRVHAGWLRLRLASGRLDGKAVAEMAGVLEAAP